MSTTDLALAPICPERGVDVVAPRETPADAVGVTRGGAVMLPTAVVARLRFPAVVLWKFLGHDGFNLIEADDWDAELGALYNVEAPRLERYERRYRIRFPKPYIAALKPQTTARYDIGEHGGRMVLSLFDVISVARLHRAW